MAVATRALSRKENGKMGAGSRRLIDPAQTETNMDCKLASVIPKWPTQRDFEASRSEGGFMHSQPRISIDIALSGDRSCF